MRSARWAAARAARTAPTDRRALVRYCWVCACAGPARDCDRSGMASASAPKRPRPAELDDASIQAEIEAEAERVRAQKAARLANETREAEAAERSPAALAQRAVAATLPAAPPPPPAPPPAAPVALSAAGVSAATSTSLAQAAVARIVQDEKVAAFLRQQLTALRDRIVEQQQEVAHTGLSSAPAGIPRRPRRQPLLPGGREEGLGRQQRERLPHGGARARPSSAAAPRSAGASGTASCAPRCAGWAGRGRIAARPIAELRNMRQTRPLLSMCLPCYDADWRPPPYSALPQPSLKALLDADTQTIDYYDYMEAQLAQQRFACYGGATRDYGLASNRELATLDFCINNCARLIRRVPHCTAGFELSPAQRLLIGFMAEGKIDTDVHVSIRDLTKPLDAKHAHYRDSFRAEVKAGHAMRLHTLVLPTGLGKSMCAILAHMVYLCDPVNLAFELDHFRENAAKDMYTGSLGCSEGALPRHFAPVVIVTVPPHLKAQWLEYAVACQAAMSAHDPTGVGFEVWSGFTSTHAGLLDASGKRPKPSLRAAVDCCPAPILWILPGESERAPARTTSWAAPRSATTAASTTTSRARTAARARRARRSGTTERRGGARRARTWRSPPRPTPCRA